MVYCHANGKDTEETIDKVGEKIEKGFKAVRVQSGIPGIEHAYGVTMDNKPYEPATKGLAQIDYWDTSKYLNFLPTLFGRVREAYGEKYSSSA